MSQANKVMHMAGIAYNLNKLLKFTTKKANSNAKAIENILFAIKEDYTSIFSNGMKLFNPKETNLN